MSTVDLMLLGALIGKPMNAYEMKKVMEFRNVKTWTKISTPSIYKNLVALSKKGYLDSKIIKEGEMPEKTIYSINQKGQDYFMLLMEKYSQEPGMVYIDFTAFTANLHNVDPKNGLVMIKTLQDKLAEQQVHIQANLEAKRESVPYHGIMMMELYQNMYTLFQDWCEQFYQEYSKNNGL